MEPFSYYFDSVERTALLLKRKKPFFDWLIYLDPADKIEADSTDHEIYLLPNFDSISEMEKWLKKNFEDIFCDQLNKWYTDESIWPQKRTFAVFKDWFDYSLHTMISDTQDEHITKY